MECQQSTDLLVVETDQAIYEIQFGQVQIEITGRCNMNCLHCRAAHDRSDDMPLEQILKIIRFARRYSPSYKEILISGGEPLMHRGFSDVLTAVRQNGGDFVTLTTNGELLTKAHMELFGNLNFERLTLSVSLDSLVASDHDGFRQHHGAFNTAIKAIGLISSSTIPGLIASIRATLRPVQIPEMEAMAQFAYDMGCGRISFSSIHPAGKSIDRPDFWMTRDQKRKFLEEIYRLKNIFPPEFNITTNDPLKCLVRGKSDVGSDNELVFDGCPAAAVTFNVNANGNMTPCALMNIPMMNVFNLTTEEMAQAYQECQIVKDMLDMNLMGKCGECDKKYLCGGCRARALIRNSHYLSEDPDCWI